VKTYYAAIPAKTADEALSSLASLEQQRKSNEEIEVRQIVPMGQKALVVYVLYERGVLR
jgi:hypothetical protein